MNQQNVQLVVWLGLPVLALVWANVKLRQTRRTLTRVRYEGDVQPIRFVPSPATAELASLAMAR